MEQKIKRQQHQKETAVKNFRYNRYLFLRYLLALFFFVNLYWTLSLILSGMATALIPGSLLVFSLLAVSEHVKLYSMKEFSGNPLKFNRLYYLVQIGVNAVMILFSLSGFGYQLFFPFLQTTLSARGVISGILAIGGGLSFLGIQRAQKISQNTDKHYQYMQEFEKEIK